MTGRNGNGRPTPSLAAKLIRQRASAHARVYGCTSTFLLYDLGWFKLEPLLAATLESRHCLDCGATIERERDVQIEHREPYRDRDDWARHHVRNLTLVCHRCNGGKGGESYAAYLDRRWEAQLAAVRVQLEIRW